MSIGSKPYIPDYPRTRAFPWIDDDDIDRLRKAAHHAGVNIEFAAETESGPIARVILPDSFSMFAFLRLAKRRNPRPHLFTPERGGGVSAQLGIRGNGG